MEIFSTKERINFVDKNNIFVGFDIRKQCCEHFGWEISGKGRILVSNRDKITEEIIKHLRPFVFDRYYYKQTLNSDPHLKGGEVNFKLINQETEDVLYLCLHNHHNGYYTHGFNFGVKGSL